MPQLSVNVNKFATLRNARGGNMPNLVDVVVDCQKFGADGITIHPRPDQRHITTDDVMAIKKVISTEYNIEGYPDQRYIDLVKQVKPEQCTLVPDPPGAITSDHGWNIKDQYDFLSDVIRLLRPYCQRISIFIDPSIDAVKQAKQINADRIELYTGPYAHLFGEDKEKAIARYVEASEMALAVDINVNAGHDLNQVNLAFFCEKITTLSELSIGHALVCDALYLGLENTINLYQRCISINAVL